MKALRVIGVTLIVACGLGFLTVFDDLRHVGELIGVSTIGVTGIVLLIWSQSVLRLRKKRSARGAPREHVPESRGLSSSGRITP